MKASFTGKFSYKADKYALTKTIININHIDINMDSEAAHDWLWYGFTVAMATIGRESEAGLLTVLDKAGADYDVTRNVPVKQKSKIDKLSPDKLAALIALGEAKGIL